MQSATELVFIDKPKGITSREAIVQLKKIRGVPHLKMGHAGTLDPNASGLLIVGVGAGTKCLKEYVGLPKTYEAEILLGISTDSGDITGKTVKEQDVFDISKERIDIVLEGMIGVLRLPVSAFSAVKRGGQPLYKRAHKGEDVGTLPLRDMQVNRAEYCSHECANKRCIVRVLFNVESGVYIRSLAEEFGRQLGYAATLKELRRTRVGKFTVHDSDVIQIKTPAQ